MTKRLGSALAVALLGFALLAFGKGPQQQQPQQQSSERAKTTAKQSRENQGEQRFAEHCGRCHAAPADIPPRAAATILRHMRVRANLTAEDERLILQYIAP